MIGALVVYFWTVLLRDGFLSFLLLKAYVSRRRLSGSHDLTGVQKEQMMCCDVFTRSRGEWSF